MKRYLMVLTLLAMIGVVGCSRQKEPERAAAPAVATEGGLAPDFTLKDLNGQDVRLSSLRGEVVLLNFWATWCPPCRGEVPSLAKLNHLMKGKPFRMLAASIDDGGKAAVEGYFRDAKVSLPALLDADGTVGHLYGITGVPETFIIDPKGVILKKVVGPIDWSAPEVVRFLDEAGKS